MTDTTRLNELRQAAAAEPKSANLRYLLGAEMAQQREYDGAIAELTNAIALDPLLHTARLQLGLLQLTLGNTQQAVIVLAPLEALAQNEPIKHFKRALDAMIKGDLGASLVHLRDGMSLNTTNEPLNRDMNMLANRVSVAMGAGQEAPATEAVRTDFSLYSGTQH